MARPLPSHRLPRAGRSRSNKAFLLPLPRIVANELSLAAHISLEALRTRNGWLEGALHLTEIMLLARFLAETGYGPFEAEALVASEFTIGAVLDRGRQSGVWELDATGYETFCAIVALHDWQLQTAPIAALAAANERLEHFKAGEPWQLPQKMRR